MSMGTGSKGPQADINITPLVDIVLVLLIIFMVITPLLTKNLPIEVPQKAETEVPPDVLNDQLVIKAFADGHLEFNKTAVTLAELPELIKDRLKGRKDAAKVVFFEGEPDTPYGVVVAAMDVAKGAGTSTIGIMTGDVEDVGGSGEDSSRAPAAPPGTENAVLGYGEPVGIGELDPLTVKQTVQRFHWDILYCYQLSLAKQPDLRGQLSIKIELTPTGLVKAASVRSSTLEDDEAETCIVDLFTKMSFPGAVGQIEIQSIPLGFAPSAE